MPPRVYGAPLRVGFVTGSTPDKWAATWRARRARDELVLVPMTEPEQEEGLRSGELDLALVRLPVDRAGLHVVPLYEERAVVVASTDHVVSAVEEVELEDLADEQLVAPHRSGWTPRAAQLAWPPMTTAEAVEVAASGAGVALMPMSVARLHHRRDVVHREVTDLEPTTVALAWRTDREDPGVGPDGEELEPDDRIQVFVGIVRGRSPRSSR